MLAMEDTNRHNSMNIDESEGVLDGLALVKETRIKGCNENYVTQSQHVA